MNAMVQSYYYGHRPGGGFVVAGVVADFAGCMAFAYQVLSHQDNIRTFFTY